MTVERVLDATYNGRDVGVGDVGDDQPDRSGVEAGGQLLCAGSPPIDVGPVDDRRHPAHWMVLRVVSTMRSTVGMV
jgi:hypothetical protein